MCWLQKNLASRQRREVAVMPVAEEAEEADVSEADPQDSRAEEIRRLRDDIVKSRRAVKVLLGETADKAEKDSSFRNMNTPLEAMRQKYKKRKAEHGDRQNEVMLALALS